MSTEAADFIFLSLLRQESSVLFLKHCHCVFCNLYNHFLLISSQSCKFSLQVQSDQHPHQTVLVLGFPTECCHLGSLASPGHSQIQPYLSSSPFVNNLQVRFLDSKQIRGSTPAFLQLYLCWLLFLTEITHFLAQSIEQPQNLQLYCLGTEARPAALQAPTEAIQSHFLNYI